MFETRRRTFDTRLRPRKNAKSSRHSEATLNFTVGPPAFCFTSAALSLSHRVLLPLLGPQIHFVYNVLHDENVARCRSSSAVRLRACADAIHGRHSRCDPSLWACPAAARTPKCWHHVSQSYAEACSLYRRDPGLRVAACPSWLALSSRWPGCRSEWLHYRAGARHGPSGRLCCRER